ncbi:tyrosine-protein phosphatase non-receptor type substrate 1-like [Acipenser ruthenus]|uniref:tyrosine-protein phosphatase non-receptor type substrate 1-like n=1 Tax=Acipenser ruthenus TaxID=7906 RepID=UPI002741E667|nr:tyrosine-protein phosphatase non-receptor type substrate 1-like [Acipenser ruthenus]
MHVTQSRYNEGVHCCALKRGYTGIEQIQFNEMLLHRSRATLVLVLFIWNAVTASQDPHVITALKGGTATIDCLHGLSNTEGMAVALQRNATLCYKVIGNYSTWEEQCNERFNMTWNNKTNTISLIIKALILNDSDIYTCKLDRVIPPPTQSITENKTVLQVTARPNIRLVYVNSSNGSTRLVCTSEGFSPKHIEVSWFKDGELISNDTHEENLTSNDDGSFTLTSYCSVSGSGDYTCQVNHSTLQSPLTASVTVSAHEDNQEPSNTFPDSMWIWKILIALGSCVLLLVISLLILTRCTNIKAFFHRPATEPAGERSTPLPSLDVRDDENCVYSLLGEHPVNSEVVRVKT